MATVGILQCPVCEKLCLCPMDRSESRAAVKNHAAAHLKTHSIDESKYGIYRVMMTERLEQIEIDNTAHPEVESWVASTAELPVLTK